MAQGQTPITVIGNIVADPELRFTPAGKAVCNFRVASTPRTFNSATNQWEDGEAMFLTVNVWGQPAENMAETLTKGMRVIVNGNLKQRSYQTREGENRTVYEVEATDVGPSLRYATAVVTRNPREGQGYQQGGGYGQTVQPQQQAAQAAGQQVAANWAQAAQGQPQQPAQQQAAPQGQQQAGNPWPNPADGAGQDTPPF